MDSSKIVLLLVLSSKLLLAATALHDADADDTLALPRLQGGQHEAVWSTSNMGEGVVIGVLDDGIDAGHPSFGDEGIPPPPARWRGRCKHPGVSSCNGKLIGARDFTRHLRRPGTAPRSGTHGTHASSVAAGAFVRRRAGNGGEGAPVVAVMSGVAPRAHLAFYQVCAARGGCSRGSVVHAVEAALADGADVLSLSLGDDDDDGGQVGFDADPVAAATFSAVARGVFVCAAAGNKGPTPGSVANDAPWILTVGASSSQQSTTTIPAFSSRGPSRSKGGVLKPDIVGPGVDLVAAVPRSARGQSSFASLSGTSMAAPHLSGVAALIKSAHPTWSPAAIKSAIMTTANASSVVTDDSTGTAAPASYFAMGAGVVDAAKAIDPGLVYDTSPEEYVPYLCGLGYADEQVSRIIYPAPAVRCAEMESTEAKDLNTPSIMVALPVEDGPPAVTVRRTVTNVGAARSVYRVDVSAPDGVSITVVPEELQFDEVNQKASFVVTMERAPGSASESEILGAQLAWVSEELVVPTGELVFKGTVLGNRDSPVVAAFSSRGPSKQNQGILKPDVTGPGVNIIAGVPKPAGLMAPPNPLAAKFDILSGTSMATPHLSGIAAVLKRAHPTWTPAAIKSAIVTTADPMDRRGKPIAAHDGYPADLLTLGAGFVDPVKALSPGLVYNLTALDYIPYLCGLRYSDQEISSIIHPLPPVACAQMAVVEQKDLNYPSITAFLDREPYVVTVIRAVTNVGRAVSVYVAKVEMPSEVSVTVAPEMLLFKKVNEEKRFTVTIRSVDTSIREGIVEGHLAWVSPKNVVRTPILVAFQKFVKDNSTTAHLRH